MYSYIEFSDKKGEDDIKYLWVEINGRLTTLEVEWRLYIKLKSKKGFYNYINY